MRSVQATLESKETKAAFVRLPGGGEAAKEMEFKGRSGLASVEIQLRDPDLKVTMSFLEAWVMLQMLAKQASPRSRALQPSVFSHSAF